MAGLLHGAWAALPWIIAYAVAFWWATDAELQYLCFKDSCPPRRRITMAITSFGVFVLAPRWPLWALHTFYCQWRFPIITGRWVPDHVEQGHPRWLKAWRNRRWLFPH